MAPDVFGPPHRDLGWIEFGAAAAPRDEGNPMSVMGSRLIAVALDEFRPPDEASRAMSLALELAQRAGAKILVVAIGKDGWMPPPDDNPFAHLVADAERTLSGQIVVRRVDVDARLVDTECAVQSKTAPHAAGEAFVATAAGFGARLLVVAASNELQPLEGLVGAIVGAADVPTVVVPSGVSRIGDCPFHVVVALDGVPHAGHVAEHISELHGWFQTSVSLLHVLHPGGGRLNGVPVLAHDRAAQMLQRSAACLGARGVESGQIHVVVRSGPTSNVIVDHLRREQATLGVLPVVASDPGHRRPHGVTSAVLAMSHVPIVLFHAWAEAPSTSIPEAYAYRH